MEKFINQEAFGQVPERTLTEVGYEGMYESREESPDQDTFLTSCRRSIHKIAKIAAMTAILGGAVSESSARENDTDSKLNKGNKDSIEKVQPRETQERVDDLLKINDICKEYGVDFIDATSPFLEVYLPKRDVKKVMIHIGQTHSIKAFENESKRGRDEIVESQKKIYDILSQAHLKSDTPPICLQEGLSTKSDVEEALNNQKTHGVFREHMLQMASDHSVDIEKIIKLEIEAVARYSIKYKDSGLKDSTLFDMSRSVQKILLEEKIDNHTRDRLVQAQEIIDKHIDHEVLVYTVGGALIAGKLEHAIIHPAESKEENAKVARKICEDLGIPYDENEDFYEVVDRLPRAQRDKAYLLVSKYGLSKERERPVMEHAEEALKKRKLVFINFGKIHGFEDVFEEKQAKDDMEHVALIKIDLERLEKVKDKK